MESPKISEHYMYPSITPKYAPRLLSKSSISTHLSRGFGHLQLDNVTTNKSKLMLIYLSWLVATGVFTKIKLGSLIVGHTHEFIDQLFSRYDHLVLNTCRVFGFGEDIVQSDPYSLVFNLYSPVFNLCYLVFDLCSLGVFNLFSDVALIFIPSYFICIPLYLSWIPLYLICVPLNLICIPSKYF